MAGERWPSGAQYVSAVQDPAACFSDQTLRRGRPREGLLGLPASASGQNAIVFPIRTGPREVAVRCFTTAQSDGRARYDALSRHLDTHSCPAMTRARWLQNGITVSDRSWPVVEMEWVSGKPFQEFVADHLDDPDTLTSLAEQWLKLARSLNRAQIAHGDLQHGNVLVNDRLRLRLVDFDGVWIPGIAERPPMEVGHPNYQHPERIERATWGRAIDAFSAMVIYASLRALAAEPDLWRFHTGENLILSAADFKSPGGTAIWAALAKSSDHEVADLADVLAELCRTTVMIDTTVDELIKHGVPDAPAYQSRRQSEPAASVRAVEQIPAHWEPVPPRAATIATPRPGLGRAAFLMFLILSLVAIGAAIAANTGSKGSDRRQANGTQVVEDDRSSQASATPHPVPTAPTDFYIEIFYCTTTSCNVRAHWTDNSTNETAWVIYVRGADGQLTEYVSQTTPQTGPTIGPRGEIATGWYTCFRVAARSDRGDESPQSDPPACTPPGGLNANSSGNFR